MISQLFGYTLSKTVPEAVLHKVISGAYIVSGGVIRNHAGHIVAHLVDAVPSVVTGNVGGIAHAAVGTINAFQLHKLGKQVHATSGQAGALQVAVQHLTHLTQGITLLAQGTLLASGLTLAVSVASFVVLSNKLGKVDERLKAMSKDIKDIKAFLEIDERSRLQNALITLTGAADNARMTMLVNTRQTLGEIHLKYRELMEKVEDYAMASAIEEYFAITALAQARCTAELDLFDFAKSELKNAVRIWRASGRRIASRFLDGSERQHLLTAKYAKVIPTDELIDCFDFTYGKEDEITESKCLLENKGIEWIDELRGKRASIPASILNLKKKIKPEEERAVELIRRLSLRNRIFEGYESQYDCFAKHRQRPSAVNGEINAIRESEKMDKEILFFVDPQELAAAGLG